MSYASEQAVLNCQWNAAYQADLNAQEQGRPFILLRPRLFPDGGSWCALYGDNVQEGVCGFGDTPDAASRDFDANWMGQKLGEPPMTTQQPRAAAGDLADEVALLFAQSTIPEKLWPRCQKIIDALRDAARPVAAAHVGVDDLIEEIGLKTDRTQRAEAARAVFQSEDVCVYAQTIHDMADDIDSLVRRLSAREHDWMPIVTAPRNGSWFIARSIGSLAGKAFEQESEARFDCDDDLLPLRRDGRPWTITPTHWRAAALTPARDSEAKAAARIAELEAAIEPWARAGGEWGKWLAWVVAGAPDRDQGRAAAKRIVEMRCSASRALALAIRTLENPHG